LGLPRRDRVPTFLFEPKEWEQQESLSPEQYYPQLRDALREIFSRYFNPTSPLEFADGRFGPRHHHGLASGGAEYAACYTFGSMYRDHEESNWRGASRKSVTNRIM